jgi:hypothetical protein
VNSALESVNGEWRMANGRVACAGATLHRAPAGCTQAIAGVKKKDSFCCNLSMSLTPKWVRLCVNCLERCKKIQRQVPAKL